MTPKNNKALRQKEVRAILKQMRFIWKQQRALGYYELKIPIRHGWYKELVIIPNVKRYKNQKAILEVYTKLEKEVWGRTKEEATKQWLAKISKSLIYKGLPTLSKKQFNKLSDKAKDLCISYQFKSETKKIRTRFYVKIPKGAYRIRFKRAFITHRKRIDPKLEQALDLLNQRLEKNGYYEESQRVYNNKWDAKPLESRKKVKQELKQLIKLYDDSNPSYD